MTRDLSLLLHVSIGIALILAIVATSIGLCEGRKERP